MGNAQMKNPDDERFRLPPHSMEAEKAVIGSMLIDKDAVEKVIGHGVEPVDFFSDFHAELYRVILGIYGSQKPVEIISVMEAVKTSKTLSANLEASTAQVLSLHHSVTTSSNADYYAKVVREKATLRKLLRAAADISEKAYRASDEAGQILDESEQAILDIRARGKPEYESVQNIVSRQLERIEKAIKHKKEVTGLATGFPAFDAMTCGLQPGNLVIVAGRPAMGKTTFAMNVAEHAAVNLKKPVLIFSLEMTRDELMMRMLCSRARIDLMDAKKGFLKKHGWEYLTTAAEAVSAADLYIDDISAGEILDIKSRARNVMKTLEKQGKELSLVVVDYLQLMRVAGRIESRQQEIAEISRSLKRLAMDMNIPIIAVSQLSRRPEDKGRERRPQLSDLRESGAIEQDADLVAGIYREEYYKSDKDSMTPEEKREAEIIIMKQRNGPAGTIKLCFMREFTRFENYDTKHPDGPAEKGEKK